MKFGRHKHSIHSMNIAWISWFCWISQICFKRQLLYRLISLCHCFPFNVSDIIVLFWINNGKKIWALCILCPSIHFANYFSCFSNRQCSIIVISYMWMLIYKFWFINFIIIILVHTLIMHSLACMQFLYHVLLCQTS